MLLQCPCHDRRDRRRDVRRRTSAPPMKASSTAGWSAARSPSATSAASSPTRSPGASDPAVPSRSIPRPPPGSSRPSAGTPRIACRSARSSAASTTIRRSPAARGGVERPLVAHGDPLHARQPSLSRLVGVRRRREHLAEQARTTPAGSRATSRSGPPSSRTCGSCPTSLWYRAQRRLTRRRSVRRRPQAQGRRSPIAPRLTHGLFVCPTHDQILYVGGNYGQTLFCKACSAAAAGQATAVLPPAARAGPEADLPDARRAGPPGPAARRGGHRRLSPRGRGPPATRPGSPGGPQVPHRGASGGRSEFIMDNPGDTETDRQESTRQTRGAPPPARRAGGRDHDPRGRPGPTRRRPDRGRSPGAPGPLRGDPDLGRGSRGCGGEHPGPSGDRPADRRPDRAVPVRRAQVPRRLAPGAVPSPPARRPGPDARRRHRAARAGRAGHHDRLPRADAQRGLVRPRQGALRPGDADQGDRRRARHHAEPGLQGAGLLVRAAGARPARRPVPPLDAGAEAPGSPRSSCSCPRRRWSCTTRATPSRRSRPG